eukprot:2038922-Alexandrium_andersonii.AAC.1
MQALASLRGAPLIAHPSILAIRNSEKGRFLEYLKVEYSTLNSPSSPAAARSSPASRGSPGSSRCPRCVCLANGWSSNVRCASGVQEPPPSERS